MPAPVNTTVCLLSLTNLASFLNFEFNDFAEQMYSLSLNIYSKTYLQAQQSMQLKVPHIDLRKSKNYIQILNLST